MYRTSFRIFSAFLLLIASLVLPIGLQAQKTKNQLEDEKRFNLKKIAEAEKILSETESEKKVTLGQLSAINQQIQARESLIKSISDEIVLLDSEINELTVVVNALNRDLTQLKDEYSKMIYASYKANQGYSILTFLFSAATFNQLFMRLRYLQQYAEARRMQAQQIVLVTQELDLQKKKIQIKRNEQKKLLDEQIAENRKLVSLRQLKNNVVSGLSKKEKELRQEMVQRKNAIDRLDKLIADMIAKEMERNKTLSSAAIKDEAALTANFEQRKNQLPWPVNPGFVSLHFGKQPHPVLKGITIDNSGIDIQTSNDAVVKAVFDGEVTTRAFIAGMNNIVIIKHGNYYTVYSKLKEVDVKKGQMVKANEPIGKVQTNADGVTELHFEIWKNVQKMDPEVWLSKR